MGLLEEYGGDAKVVAGATALTILLRNRLIAPRALISLGRVRDGLRTIREELCAEIVEYLDRLSLRIVRGF